MKVLITGSREASPAMLAKAREVVAWCQTEGHELIVGDAPGVDSMVRHECFKRGVPVRVFGAYSKIRDPHIGTFSENRVLTPGTYPERDRVMAKQCDICVAVWNGKSRGTQITFYNAKKLGKRVILRIISD